MHLRLPEAKLDRRAPNLGRAASSQLPDLRDLALGAGLTLVLVLQLTPGDEPWHLLAALFAGLPLAYRRRFPLRVFFLVFAGVVAVASDTTFWPAMIAGMTATYSVGVYGQHRILAAAILLVLATALLLNFGGQLPPVPEFLSPYLLLCTPWLAGLAIRGWQQRTHALEDKARRLEEEQARAAEAARVEERRRIARELHDVVAHGVSVMVIQAGAARQVMGSSPEQAAEALLAVEATGRQAMRELRSLLGVLNADGEVELAPQPGLDQLDSLVRSMQEAGLPVEVRVSGEPRPLPQSVELTAYRIVQEALTNSLKHSGLAQTEVVLDYRDRELKIEIVDEGEAIRSGDNGSPGHGLVGMRERVRLYGGTLEAGPRLERGYAIRAHLPLEQRVQ